MSADEPLAGLEVAQGKAGHTQLRVQSAIAAAQLDDRDAGMAALAEACARAVDLAHYRRDPYAVASAARELRETLIRLKLDPVSREGADAGNVEKWLAALSETTEG